MVWFEDRKDDVARVDEYSIKLRVGGAHVNDDDLEAVLLHKSIQQPAQSKDNAARYCLVTIGDLILQFAQVALTGK